jgi:AcrR family transcriptional regulator
MITHPTSDQPPIPSVTRHRAPALAPDKRRQEVVAATVPLVLEYGAGTTTAQIAEAAGIAEGTIFRVFQDKREVLLAALFTALSADAEVEQIANIPNGDSLAGRLLAAMSAISAYQDRLWSVMRALHELGWRHDHDDLKQDDDGPRHQMQRIAVAIAAMFEPRAGSLQFEPLPAARIFLALAFTSRLSERGMGEPSATPEQLVNVFLYGALCERGDSDRNGAEKPC